MFLKNATSRRILELCEKNNITPNHLAELSAIAPTTLNDIINEKVNKPNSFVIYKICKTLQISMSEFYNSSLFDTTNLED